MNIGQEGEEELTAECDLGIDVLGQALVQTRLDVLLGVDELFKVLDLGRLCEDAGWQTVCGDVRSERSRVRRAVDVSLARLTDSRLVEARSSCSAEHLQNLQLRSEGEHWRVQSSYGIAARGRANVHPGRAPVGRP